MDCSNYKEDSYNVREAFNKKSVTNVAHVFFFKTSQSSEEFFDIHHQAPFRNVTMHSSEDLYKSIVPKALCPSGPQTT